jgi:hypothetical protein
MMVLKYGFITLKNQEVIPLATPEFAFLHLNQIIFKPRTSKAEKAGRFHLGNLFTPQCFVQEIDDLRSHFSDISGSPADNQGRTKES